ncbi:protein HEXIM1-like [Adelges cooleyi]|uniref:protein HEXIM1-like n=1 Tax=Adelges cooleyi TaxID=133065 RepID=UPI0021800F03|nr:protein HEXIM1-like [Adelges cooleyi]
MEDVQNGAVVATALAPHDNGGMIANQAEPAAVSAAPPGGVQLNHNNNNNSCSSMVKGQFKGPGNPDHRTRRPRRGKRKSKKMPYILDRMYRRKAVAPNNTNQFLMEDHNNGTELDRKLLEEENAHYNRMNNGRTRNSSYTSVESDGIDHMLYSSSDEDAASMQKEFCDTYRLVQEEQLGSMSKQDLIQRVLDLEEKIQTIESKRYRKNIMKYINGTPNEDEDSIDPDEYRLMKIQVRDLTSQNKVLQTEIETLKKQVQSRTNDSSVDSETSSDSSDSSSSSSDGQEIEMSFLVVRSDERTNCDDQKTNDQPN